MATRYANQPAKRIPVLDDVDVLVVGAGTSGLFAALGAAKAGARTALVERFVDLGGGFGIPGGISLGGIDNEADQSLVGGLCGLAHDFVHRLDALRGASPRSNSNCAATASYLASLMLEEYGVTVLTGVAAADPVMSRGRVGGIHLETKAGRRALRARVTIDATGDAEIAVRAGAKMIRRTRARPSFAPIVRGGCINPKWETWNDTELKFLVVNINRKAYDAFLAGPGMPLSQRDAAVCGSQSKLPDPLKPLVAEAVRRGALRLAVTLAPDNAIFCAPRLPLKIGGWGAPRDNDDDAAGAGFAEGWIWLRGEFDVLDAVQMSKLESEIRRLAFEIVLFHRDNVPGFERAYLYSMVPFLGARGGPCIRGVHTLTPEESIRGARFDDVMYVNIHEALHGGAPAGFDVPYRILVPEKVDGLLVTGRGAAYIRRGHDPSGMRCRPTMLLLGQATGLAAALAARAGLQPRHLAPRRLQRALLREGFFLGDLPRLKALKLK